MLKFVYKRYGFTLMETLIAVAIVVLVIMGAVGIYTMSMTIWKEGSTQIALQRRASLAMEKMVRGVDGIHGIREAVVGTISITNNNHRIDFTSKDDGIRRAFDLAGTEIIHYPDNSVVAEDVADLNFTGTDVIVIDLTLSKQVIDKSITTNLKTEVRIRNQ